MNPKNKILTLEIEPGNSKKKEKWHGIFKGLIATIQTMRGHEISTGRQYIDAIGVNPDIVDRKKEGRKQYEWWYEIIVTSDRHLEENETVKRLLRCGALTDIIKFDINKIRKTDPFDKIISGLRYRLPE